MLTAGGGEGLSALRKSWYDSSALIFYEEPVMLLSNLLDSLGQIPFAVPADDPALDVSNKWSIDIGRAYVFQASGCFRCTRKRLLMMLRLVRSQSGGTGSRSGAGTATTALATPCCVAARAGAAGTAGRARRRHARSGLPAARGMHGALLVLWNAG